MTYDWLAKRAALPLAFGLLTTSGAAEAQVVINEVDYDQPSTDTAEFVELFNAGDTAVDLSGYALVFQNGANDTEYNRIALDGAMLEAGGYYVVCANAATVSACDLDVSPDTNLIQNGAPDALALTLDGVPVDALSYEGDVPGFVEGTGAGLVDDPGAPESLSRCPDGADSDSNVDDFVAAAPTPGAANDCGGEPPPPPPTEIGDCGDAATPIHAVQGSGDASPLVGQALVIEGVVVGDFQDAQINGFFVQEEDADVDADPLTSEGIFVYEGSLEVALAPGDVVRVYGDVAEFSSLTELTDVQVLVCPSSGQASPASLSFPVDDAAELERYEGMLVHVAETLTVTETYDLGRYGSLSLSAGGRLYQPTHEAMPGAAAVAVAELNARRRIVLDDASTSQNPNPIPYLGASGTRRVGDTIPSLTGVLSGRFGDYRIQPTEPVSFMDSNPRPAAPADVGGDVKVASFNVLNFFVTLDQTGATCGPAALGCRGADSAEEYARQLDKTVTALARLDADVVALNEIENDEGAAAQALVDGLNAQLGDDVYAAVQTGSLGTDAIKLAFLYKPAVVSPVGSFAVLDSSVDPRFLDTKNRPSLAQTFEAVATGERVTVVNNHLKSKGSACDDVGDPDLGDYQGNCNATRTQAALSLIDWLASDPTEGGTDRVLVVGDLNAYAMEDPIQAFVDAGYEKLVQTFVGDDAYSYIFFGESGYLDHALANAALAERVTGVTEWHINTDEPSVMDYNTEFKTQDPFDATTPFRASDHDPLLVGLDMSRAVPRCAGMQATVYVDEGVVVGGPLDGQAYRGRLFGTSGNDVIVATAADDIVHAFAGADVVCGGEGDDRIFGLRGDDLLFGEGGDDLLFGGPGRDLLEGGSDRDACFGGGGQDTRGESCER